MRWIWSILCSSLCAGGALAADLECSQLRAPLLDWEVVKVDYIGSTQLKAKGEADISDWHRGTYRDLVLTNLGKEDRTVHLFESEKLNLLLLTFKPQGALKPNWLEATNMDTGKSHPHKTGGTFLGNRDELEISPSTKPLSCVIYQDKRWMLSTEEAKLAGLLTEDVFITTPGVKTYRLPDPSPTKDAHGGLGALFSDEEPAHKRPALRDLGSIADKFTEGPTIHDLGSLSGGLADTPAKPRETGLSAAMAGITPTEKPAPSPEETETAALDPLLLEGIRAGVNSSAEFARTRKVCHGATGEQLDLLGDLPPDPYVLVGRLSDESELQVYERFDGRDVISTDTVIDIKDNVVGRYAPITQPFGLDDKTILNADPRKLAGINIAASDWIASDTTQPVEGEVIDVLVVSDAAMLRISGLDRLEEDLVVSWGKLPWRIHWAQVLENGAIEAPVPYSSAAALINDVRDDKSYFEPTTQAKMTKLLANLQAVSSTGSKWAKVFWLLEGKIYPYETPLLLQRALYDIEQNEDAMLRLGGTLRPWLEVITGSFAPPEASFLLSGPLAQATPQGRLTIESRRTEPRILLSDTSSIVRRMVSLLRRIEREHGSTFGITPDVPGLPENPIFDHTKLFTESGIIIDVAQSEAIQTGAVIALAGWELVAAGKEPKFEGTELDLVTLAQLTTNDVGQIVPRRLETRGFTRRIKRFNSSETRKAEAERIKSWINDLNKNVSAFKLTDSDCTHIFFADTALRSEAVK